MAKRSTEDTLKRLRIVGALEVAVDQLLAEKVKEARELRFTWEKIGDALGMSDSRANVRWKGIENRPADRTGHDRRKEFDLRIAAADKRHVDELCKELGVLVLNPRGTRQWEIVLKSVLTTKGHNRRPTKDDSGGVTFHLSGSGVFLTCYEKSDGRSIAGIVATLPAILGIAHNESLELWSEADPATLVDEIGRFVDSVVRLTQPAPPSETNVEQTDVKNAEPKQPPVRPDVVQAKTKPAASKKKPLRVDHEQDGVAQGELF
jgi:hypothetical protein